MRKSYFEVPTQVRYWDDGSYCTGIAFGDVVICACCGGTTPLEQIYEFADEDGVQPIYEYNEWVDLIEAIGGGDIEGEIEAGYFKE